MTTVYDWAKQQLVERGMWENDADTVIEQVKLEKQARAISWTSPIDASEVFYAALLMTLARHTLDWLDENMPQAFFRSLFEELVPQPLDADLCAAKEDQ